MPGLKLLLIRTEGAWRLSELAPDPSITLLIGPEGRFAEEEASAALRAGYRPYGSAHGSCRTETGAVAASSALQALSGAFGQGWRLADCGRVYLSLRQHGPHRTPPRDPTALSVLFG